MNHFGDEHPPGADARPYLPTEIDHTYPPDENAHGYRPASDASGYPPAADARGFLPTEIEHPGPSPDGGSGYRATYTGTGEPAPPYSPGRTGSHTPGHAAAGHAAPGGLTRYGPGVPAAPAASVPHAAERIWRSGRADQSPGRPPRRPGRWRGRASAALTVILLAATAVVLFVRLHHAPFHVTGVAIAPPTRNGCGVGVTAEVSTNGAAGTVSYQWLFRPEGQAPQPLSKSVAAGQNAVYVTVAVQGSGHGTASRTVTLQVLGPDVRSASIPVTLRC
ncbi:MAG TPA: hypothetical protein VFV73_31320 [Streptosporangiaceae bacterium]|nr:hypothetical protein [Streptosporangiaceae bacterium]